MSTSKELKHLLNEATLQGCRVTFTTHNHYKVYAPSGKLVVISSTPSDGRAMDNIRRDLKSAGVVIIKKNRRK